MAHFSADSAINRCADVSDTQHLRVCIFKFAVFRRLTGPCLSCLTLASPCSCSVRFGTWSGARRLIAACQEGMVLLLDAPGREEPLTAEDLLLNGANLVCIPGTLSATVLWLPEMWW